MENFNRNFTVEEIDSIICSLKQNKAPGIDQIPAEFIKHCKTDLLEDITGVLNYIIEQREFPDIWAEGIRTPVFKAGMSNMPENYRGITVLPVFEKIFEMAVQKRMEFTFEAFGKVDQYNGGFLKGSRTSDNVFILNSLIERQLILGRQLIVIFVDFSRAFDVINREIMFYKLMQSGVYGRVVDTLRNLYSKTQFRVKHGGKLSQALPQYCGVNQGGNASTVLFRRYMADLRSYLSEQCGVILCDDEIMMNMSWADDLYLISDGQKGAQKHIDGLKAFCSRNQTGVNEIKTKFMVFGKQTKVCLTFDNKPLEEVKEYKNLGHLLKSTTLATGDIFLNHYDFICNKARKAIFSVQKKVKSIGDLPPRHMLYIYETLVQPILLYGSDIWGSSLRGGQAVDKIFLLFSRLILRIKATTSNIMVMGECGKIPPSVLCKINTLKYFLRARNLPSTNLVNKAFCELQRLHSLGFRTWYSRVCELASTCNVDITIPNTKGNQTSIKQAVKAYYTNEWYTSLNNTEANPILRTYKQIKNDYSLEPYLDKVNDPRYRNAITRLRTSSHILEIERGRYTKPVTPLECRTCALCNVVEDEIHFLIECQLYSDDRQALFDKISEVDQHFLQMDTREKFVFLLTTDNAQYLSWIGKFIFVSFKKRAEKANLSVNTQ